MELAVTNCLDSTRELRAELIATAKDQTNELPSVIRTGNELVTTITNCATTSDVDVLDKTASRFQEAVDHIAEITKLLRHLANNENLQVTAKHAEINLKIYAPQVVAAAQTLAHHPGSKIAKENLEGEIWKRWGRRLWTGSFWFKMFMRFFYWFFSFRGHVAIINVRYIRDLQGCYGEAEGTGEADVYVVAETRGEYGSVL